MPRDSAAATLLFLATAAFTLWQDSHLAVLWDLGYILDTSWRIALGQLPYRDFPQVHAPLTFLVQAAILRLTGRVFFHHVLYASVVGALGTLVTWRILLRQLARRVQNAWTLALLLALPLVFLGIYSIFPQPFYDCDCAFTILLSLWLLRRLRRTTGRLNALAAGASIVLPLFVKQNMGLPYLLAAGLLLLLLWFRTPRGKERGTLLTALCGMAGMLALALLALEVTVGLGNYYHWTIQFAAERRMPALGAMLGVYQEPLLLAWLPAAALAVWLLGRDRRSMHWLAAALLAAPFLWVLIGLLGSSDADDRAGSLLALWPLVLALAAVSALASLRKGLTLERMFPLLILATIHGTLMSQQLWGSTYAIWPLLLMLLAELMALIAARPGGGDIPLALTAVVAATLMLAGGLYAASEDRLSYAAVNEGELHCATWPALRGMCLRGDSLPGFEELLRFADREIPAGDGILLLPSEDPFYFATGRTPRFPVLLFDPTTDPYSPDEMAREARRRGIRWVIVKRKLQCVEDPTPAANANRSALLADFAPYRRLANYDVYRRITLTGENSAKTSWE